MKGFSILLCVLASLRAPKKISRKDRRVRGTGAKTQRKGQGSQIGKGLAFVAVFFCCACATLPPFPAVDLSNAGWQTKQGQAIWKPRKNAPELAGDLLVAVNRSGAAMAQFSKTLPIANVQITASGWEASFGPEGKRYSSRGKPPSRIVWFELIRALRNEPLQRGWSLKANSQDHIALESSSGESLEVFFQ
jgi:hypothetical protein